MPPESRPGAAGLPLARRPGAAGLPPASSRSAASNRATSRWNANTKTGRRCRDLFWSYWKQAGSPTEPAVQAALMALSEQIVIAEQARAECLANGGLTKISLELVIRAENLANRTLKRLKLDKAPSAPRKSFTERLREDAARRAIAETPPDGGAA